MCGIAGSVHAAGEADAAPVESLVSRLSHRGPDASGMLRRDACVLGQTRLRIIDLSPLGDQPMCNEDGSVWLTFNGEIYNFVELREELRAAGHTFHSATDSEVLVHLYEHCGDDMVRRLRGMFAFAIWDDRRRRLLLARDRLGIKPLYYRLDGDDLRFASEASPLAPAGTPVDRRSVVSFLQMGWVPGPATIWEGVSELLPGHTLTWSDGRTEIRAYWRPATPAEGLPAGRGGVEGVRHALLDSMRRHVVADVPVGLFLSAGVDSVALAALGRSVDADIRAFTVAFDTGPDEAAEAAAVARGLDLPHTTIPVSGAEVLASVGRIVEGMDQPTVDGVNTWVISQAVRAEGIVVALSGLGGDELFAGYSTFRHVPRLARLGAAAGLVPEAVRQRAAGVLAGPEATRYSRLGRAATAVADGGLGPAYAAVRGLLSPAEARRLAGWDGDGPAVRGPGNGAGAVAPVTELELGNYLPFQLLRDSDVMSMAHALELRVPLLDDEVLTAALADAARPGELRGKRLLAAAAGCPNAEALATRRKRTFTLPFDTWLRGPLDRMAHDSLHRLTEPDLGLDLKAVTALWDAWQRGRVGWRTIWGPAALGMWLDAHRR